MAKIRAGYHANPQFPVGNFNPKMWQALRWGYYRLIEKVDAELGKVLDALQAAGLDDKTVIVFTADHGECAGAHGFNQKTVFYEESARVPLIISAPGQRAARVVQNFANTGSDVLPTLLDFAGIAQPARITGPSLRPLALGQDVKGWRDHVVVENNMSQTFPVDGNVPTTQGRMLRAERYKYCVYAHGQNRESLVDLETDPGEMMNLARDPAHRATLLAFRERLRAWGLQHKDPLIAEMLANDVGPKEFAVIGVSKNQRRADEITKKKKRAP
jgi:arylsulfatase A-like enzyme